MSEMDARERYLDGAAESLLQSLPGKPVSYWRECADSTRRTSWYASDVYARCAAILAAREELRPL